MPEKNRAERERRAKSRGVTVAVKERDVTGARTLSGHSAKKSGGVVTRAGFNDRSVSTGRSPGRGKTLRGRVLPLPLMMPWGEWAVLVVQLGVFLVILRHDRAVLGGIHPATWAGMAIVTVQHVVIESLAIAPPFVRFANAIAAG